jgi:hypothetical protein
MDAEPEPVQPSLTADSATPLSLKKWVLLGVACAVVLLIFGIWIRFMIWVVKHSLTLSDSITSQIEQRGPIAIVGYVMIALIFGLIPTALFAHLRFHRLFAKADEKFRWLYTTVIAWGILLLFSIVTTPLLQRLPFIGQSLGPLMIRHNEFYRVTYQVYVVVFLAVLGACLYIFKQKSQLVFGLSEVAVAVISNATLVSKIDFTQFPQISTSTQDWIGICVFTYLLSRGVGNIVEGIITFKTKYKDRIDAFSNWARS